MTDFTDAQLALQSHIEAQNAATVERMEREGATWYCTTVSDPAHWAERDVFTVEQYERYELMSYISDAHKDAYGFRPRGYNFAEWSIAQLEEEADRLSDVVVATIEQDKIREQQDIEKFERNIEELIDMGAGNRETAIRWICDGINHGGDLTYVCYELGLPFSMADELLHCVAA